MTHLDCDVQALKKENHPKVQRKGTTKVRTQNLLFIIVIRKDILLICVGKSLKIRMSGLRT